MTYPMIAVTSDCKEGKYMIRKEYTDAILEAGGLPVCLPYTSNQEVISSILNQVNGVLLSGGEDIDPLIYGEEPSPKIGKINPERDAFEVCLTRFALNQNLPILAICRGQLLLNVAAGGTLYQDVYAESGATLQHKQLGPRDHASHRVKVKSKTRLHEIVKADTLLVNSFHHQAVKKLAPGFRISAEASDGVIEAIESTNHAFVIGVQWHPGSLITKDIYSRAIFRAFVTVSASSS